MCLSCTITDMKAVHIVRLLVVSLLPAMFGFFSMSKVDRH